MRLIGTLLAAAALAVGSVAIVAPASGSSVAQTAKKKCKAKKGAASAKKKKCKRKKGSAPGTTPQKQAQLSISPTNRDFGLYTPTPESTTQTFTVSNAGPDASGSPSVTISSAVNGTPSNTFTITGNTCTAPIAPAGNCSVTVTFNFLSGIGASATGSLTVSATPGGTVVATFTGSGS